MTIKLNDNYRIEGDTYNWTLVYEEKRQEIKDGKEKTVTSTAEWHYPSLAACLRKFTDQSLKVCENALIDKLKEIDLAIEQAISKASLK